MHLPDFDLEAFDGLEDHVTLLANALGVARRLALFLDCGLLLDLQMLLLLLNTREASALKKQ